MPAMLFGAGLIAAMGLGVPAAATKSLSPG